MLTTFSGEFGKRLAQRWSGALSVPAFAVWVAAGAVAVLDPLLWATLEPQLSTLSEKQQIVLGIGLLLLMTLSSILVRYLTPGVLASLAGHWPAFTSPLSDLLCDRFARRVEKDRTELADLFRRLHTEGEFRNRRERQRYGILEQRLRHCPSDPSLCLPTRLGNILRAAELRPREKYGLAPAATWPAIRLLLPEEVSDPLEEAYEEFNNAGQALVWICVLLLASTVWILVRTPSGEWWQWVPAAIAAIVAVALGYRAVLNAAKKLGNLFETCFDLFRSSLYDSLHLTLPDTPEAERIIGEQLSTYLWRGYAGDFVFNGDKGPPDEESTEKHGSDPAGDGPDK